MICNQFSAYHCEISRHVASLTEVKFSISSLYRKKKSSVLKNDKKILNAVEKLIAIVLFLIAVKQKMIECASFIFDQKL